jgi:hypothetical protein
VSLAWKGHNAAGIGVAGSVDDCVRGEGDAVFEMQGVSRGG